MAALLYKYGSEQGALRTSPEGAVLASRFCSLQAVQAAERSSTFFSSKIKCFIITTLLSKSETAFTMEGKHKLQLVHMHIQPPCRGIVSYRLGTTQGIFPRPVVPYFITHAHHSTPKSSPTAAVLLRLSNTFCASFSPQEGRRLLTFSHEGAVRIWRDTDLLLPF